MNIKLIFILAIGGLGSVLLNGCSSSDEAPIDSKSGKALTLDASFLRTESMNIDTRAIAISSDTVFAGVMHYKEVEMSTSEISRAPLDDSPTWSGSEAVTVKVDGRYFEYSIGGSGSSSTMTSASPYYFTTTSNVTVNAWYPSSGAANKTTHEVLANQSTDANFKNSDFMYGSGTVSHANSANSISMAHKIAKVRVTVNVVNPSYLNNSTVNSVVLSGTKRSSSVGSNGALTASGDASDITMHKKSNGVYEACIIPQTATLTFKVNVGGTIYTSTAVASRAYAANNIYTATVKITAQPLLYQGDGAVNIGDFYGTFANGQAVLIDGTTAAVAAAKNRGAIPIAIVYSTSTSSTDRANGWTKGYAFALKEVGNYAWSTNTSSTVMATVYSWGGNWASIRACTEDYDGYTATRRITNNGTYNATTYPAFFAAVNFQNTVTAPPTSSKWYLPSDGQWYQFLRQIALIPEGSTASIHAPSGMYFSPNKTYEGNINDKLSVAGSGNYTAFPIHPAARSYWSSSEASASNGVLVIFQGGSHSGLYFYHANCAKTLAYCVRAAVAF
ncbi:MAG: fimbrillin family protein [Prevotella sp.]|nr:fimbrillin family protein [Prevotella sp.]